MNINNNPTHRANLGYNGFAMDKLHKFSSTVGELRPVYYDFLSPGDKVSLSCELKTRTMEVESAAMCSLTEHVDWFFVPMTRLYKLFPEFYYGVNDNQTSFVSPSNFKGIYPNFPISTFKNLISYSTSETDTYFDTFSAQNLRLIEDLGFPLKKFISEVKNNLDGDNNVRFNPMFFQAYQCIYQDKFRLSDREMADASSYNVDKYYNNPTIGEYNDILFTLRYAPWKKDFYTDLQVSPIFGVGNQSSFNSIDYGAVNQWLSTTQLAVQDSSNINTETTFGGNAANVGIEENGSQDLVTNMASINTANIRTIFAVEKLLEITRRAGKHYDKQTLAHFGVDVPMGLDGECIYIGGSESKINIGDVISTSDTDLAGLGKVGGKGYGFGKSGTDKFEAKCHGILMAIYHCVPDVDYYQNGLDRLNTWMNRQDFFIPEYDNLGMQPLFKYQNNWDVLATERSKIEGWQYRYKELKQKYNTVIGNLAGSLKYWTPAQTALSADTDLSSFLIRPNYLDNIMLVKYNPKGYDSTKDSDVNYNQIWDTDPLFHELYLDVRKASKMSTYGLPQL